MPEEPKKIVVQDKSTLAPDESEQPPPTPLITLEQKAFASTDKPEHGVVEKTFIAPKDERVMKDGEVLQFPPGVGEGVIAGEAPLPNEKPPSK